jgi:hypothetical protein
MYQETNNCYSYAADDYRSHSIYGKPTPGAAGGQNAPYIPTCLLLMYNAALDGIKSCGQLVIGSPSESTCKGYNCDAPCPKGQFKIMLFKSKSIEFEYHFYRQDQSGCWSHKRGRTAVTNLDSTGNLIGDPRRANRSYIDITYDDFCGCLCVVPGTRTETPDIFHPSQ